MKNKPQPMLAYDDIVMALTKMYGQTMDTHIYSPRDLLDSLQGIRIRSATEVVPCCECKYGVWDEYEEMWKCVYSAEFDEGISEYLGFVEYHDGDHFCSYGELREEAGNG